MCGIVGTYGGSSAINSEFIRQACNALAHRGPDAKEVWLDPDDHIHLGHTRLAILDLSPAGGQPMTSHCGRYVIVFNGEIYNHQEIRKELAAAVDMPWRGRSDTETFLAAISHWGLEKSLEACVGMFAFGLWDRTSKTLSLARDRLGEKPLYYGYAGTSFVFGSELKSLAHFPGFRKDVDRGALTLFMRYNYIPAPCTIYSGIHKLLPGSWVRLSKDMVDQRVLPRPERYWSAIECAHLGIRNPYAFESDGEATTELEHILRRSIAGQMIADVPLGAFLSGGVDSSTTVALMQAESRRPVRTFSIGFDIPSYNEAPHANRVAKHLGTDHTELYVSAADTLAVVPKLPGMYDEPFADASQVPTYLVAKLARQHVTVSLSGDGGDELFGGYQRYFIGARAWRHLERLPRAVRWLAAKAVLSAPPMAWDALYALFAPLIPPQMRLAAPGDQLHKGARLLDAESGMLLYRRLVSHWNPDEVVLQKQEPRTDFDREDLSFPSLAETMMALDAVTYLPDDILTKVDRAAMAVSLETRVPLLDHRVFEFAWRLPFKYKVRDGESKWLLRQVLYRHVPRHLIERPKMGFGVPIDSWLRGPLRHWAEALLDETRIKNEGYFDPKPIRRKWSEHLSGRRNWQYYLWDVLMFQAWLDHQRDAPPRAG
jgi:asparagine synthase (glutamine-hydrolysing)